MPTYISPEFVQEPTTVKREQLNKFVTKKQMDEYSNYLIEYK